MRGQAFNVGDLVLRFVHSNKSCHKLSSPWEGPYIIAEVLKESWACKETERTVVERQTLEGVKIKEGPFSTHQTSRLYP